MKWLKVRLKISWDLWGKKICHVLLVILYYVTAISLTFVLSATIFQKSYHKRYLKEQKRIENTVLEKQEYYDLLAIAQDIYNGKKETFQISKEEFSYEVKDSCIRLSKTSKSGKNLIVKFDMQDTFFNESSQTTPTFNEKIVKMNLYFLPVLLVIITLIIAGILILHILPSIYDNLKWRLRDEKRKYKELMQEEENKLMH